MNWYDPKMARWVEWVLKTIEAVNNGHFYVAETTHRYSCEAHVDAVLHADRVFPGALGGIE